MNTKAPEPSLLDGLRTESRQTITDLRQLAETRWQLASLELKAARASIERYGISLAIAALLAVISLPILVTALVDAVGPWFDLPRWALLAITAGIMLVAAGALAWLARRRFQYEFVGLEETMEEFREDAVWLREWLGESGKNDSSDTP